MASKKTAAEIAPEEITSIEESSVEETPTGEETPQIELDAPAPQKEDPGHNTRAFRN